MCKAIVWAGVALLITVVLPGPAAAIAVTLVCAVAGAVNWGRRMCEPRRGVPVRAYVAVAGVVAAVVAVHAVLPFLLPAVPVLAVLAVVSVPALRRARRLCVPRSSAFHARYQRIAARPAARQTALPVGSSLRAIEAPKRVIRGAIINERERTGHER